MEKDIIKIPIKKRAKHGPVIECYVNNYFKGLYIVDLERKESLLNYKYFSQLFSLNEEEKVFIRNINCKQVSMKNSCFKLGDLITNERELNGTVLYGILGQDFFQNYVFTLEDDTFLMFKKRKN